MVKLPADLKDHPLADKILAKIKAIDAVANDFPGVIVVNNIQSYGSVIYMSPRGLKQLGVTLRELQAVGGMDYHEKFFNPEYAQEYIPKVFELLERNNADESISFFQQVRKSPGSNEYIWHMSSLKILMHDVKGNPLLCVTTSHAINPEHEPSQKVSKLLDQNNLLRQKYQLYARLSRREREILKHIALGKSSADIAAELFISAATAETHRRNIRQKLKAFTSYELTQYAQAFDLI